MNRRSRGALATVCLASFALTSCRPSDAESSGQLAWTDSSFAVGFRTITTEGACNTCIHVTPVVELGEPDGPGFLTDSQHVLQDRLGRYWVSQAGLIKVFGRDGAFVGVVGKPGEGPGEFRRPIPIYVDRDGRVQVVDVGNARLSIVDENFALVADRVLAISSEAIVALKSGTEYVVNEWRDSPEQLGMPLHRLVGDSIIQSYGFQENSNEEASEFLIRRVLSVDGNDRLFTGKYYDFEFEVWGHDGRRIAGYTARGFNATRPLGGAISDANPYLKTIRGMYADEQQRLWVLSWKPKSDWRDQMEEVQRPNGNIVLRRKTGVTIEDLWLGHVDVIDLNTAALIAQYDSPTLYAGFLDENTVWAPSYFPDGSPRFVVEDIRLDGP